jgi:hypothetical protein
MDEKCDYDNVTGFAEGSLQITDVDGDGVGEITFAYRVGCVSDMSPVTLKLLVLEGGEKYIIRGTTVIDFGDGDRVGGDKNVDASLKKAPAAIREHADAQWARVVTSR